MEVSEIHSARQGLNSPTWKQTDDKLVKSQLCPVGGAVVPAKVSPSCEGEATISTSAGLGSFVFPPAFWSLLKLCSFFLPSCPVCCTIHNSIFFPSSLYDFIVFYKKKKKTAERNTANPESKSSSSFFSASERRVFGVPSSFQQVDVLFLYQHCFKVSRWLADAKETLLPLVP